MEVKIKAVLEKKKIEENEEKEKEIIQCVSLASLVCKARWNEGKKSDSKEVSET